MNPETKKPTDRPHFAILPKRPNSKTNNAILYIRCFFGKAVIEKSLGIKIPFDTWNSKTHSTPDSLIQSLATQKYEEAKQRIMGAFYALKKQDVKPTLKEIIAEAYAEEEGKSISLFSAFTDFIEKMEKEQTMKSQYSYILKHQTCMKHLKAFVKKHCNATDIPFSRINRNFIEEFEIFLKTHCGNNHNAALKLIQIFKKIYQFAVDNRWTSNNAFSGKKLSYRDVDIIPLTADEVDLLKNAVITKPHLEKTRQLFLFCIYTGMAYVDMQQLKRKHIQYNAVSNQYMIRNKRLKTHIEFLLPLFAPAHNILDLWLPGWEKAPDDKLLAPRICNQPFNNNLKELAAFCQIHKHLTTHIGRHTFATTIALENGVPTETVAKMLGHAKISQTQKYAKVTNIKVERETRELVNLLKK